MKQPAMRRCLKTLRHEVDSYQYIDGLMQQQNIVSYVVLTKFFSINNFDFEMSKPIVMFMMQ